jgi:hypothetical protein
MSNICPSFDGIDVSAAGSLRLSAGMVSGGAGADIGRTHRYAMRLDDRFTLDAGVFGRSATSSSAVAASLGVADDRVYGDYREMATAESQRPDGMDLVVVATPNDSHLRSPGPSSRQDRRGVRQAPHRRFGVADEVKARRDGLPTTIRELSFPTGIDGLLGVEFVEAVAASHHADSAWVTLSQPTPEGQPCSVSP